MSTTVLEALQNAQCNIETITRMGPKNPILMMALEQLKNGVEALENDFGPHDVIQENIASDVKTTK